MAHNTRGFRAAYCDLFIVFGGKVKVTGFRAPYSCLGLRLEFEPRNPQLPASAGFKLCRRNLIVQKSFKT